MADVITFPKTIDIKPKAGFLYPEHIIVRWKSKVVFEQLLVVYRQVIKKTFMSHKIVYEATETELIPGHVGIINATIGFANYKYHLHKHIKDPIFFDEDRYSLIKNSDVAIKYDVDTLQAFEYTAYNKRPCNLFCYWRDCDLEGNKL